MKKIVFVFILFFGIITTFQAQISVYDCEAYGTLFETDITSGGQLFKRGCVDFNDPNGYSFSQAESHIVESASSIHLQSGFYAGNFDPTSQLHLKIGEKSDFDVAVMNYATLDEILKYEKFELGINLPSEVQAKLDNFVSNASVPNTDKLNPYLEWNIRIVAEFTCINSNYTKEVDGFYFINYERNESTEYWTDLGTVYDFRVRFAPNIVGKWNCVIKIYIDNLIEFESDIFPFKVIESSNPGFVKVNTNGKNLNRGDGNGEDNFIFPVGPNLADLAGPESILLSWNSGFSHFQNMKNTHWKEYIQQVQKYAELGGKYFRFIIGPQNCDVEFEKLGNYTDRLPFSYEMDNIIDFAHQNDMLIHLTLNWQMNQMFNCTYKMFHWDFDPINQKHQALGWPADINTYCYATPNAEFTCLKPSDVINNEESFKYVKQKYRYYIARYGYSTNISMFELQSEPWHMNAHIDGPYDDNASEPLIYEPAHRSTNADGDEARLANIKYHHDLADFIKNHLGHTEHLLAAQNTLTNEPVSETYMIGDNAFDPGNGSTWDDPNIDVVSISNYFKGPNKFIGAKDNEENNSDNLSIHEDENSFYENVKQVYDRVHKPIVISETGEGFGYSCSNYSQERISVMRLGFSGVAGFYTWETFNYNTLEKQGVNENILFPALIRTQNHMGGLDARKTLKSNWQQGREHQYGYYANGSGNKVLDALEQQYYVSENQENAIGYVYNRTYNERSNALSSPCSATDFPPVVTIGIWNQQQDFHSAFANGLFTDKRLELQGLKDNTDYRIHWYNYDGSYSQSLCFNTTGGGVYKMYHPDVDGVNPLLWYVVEQFNCESGMALQLPNEANLSTIQEQEKSNSLQTKDELLEIQSIYPNPSSSGDFFLEGNFTEQDLSACQILNSNSNQIPFRIEQQAENKYTLKVLAGKGVYFIQIGLLTYKIVIL